MFTIVHSTLTRLFKIIVIGSFQVYDQLQSLAKHNPWFVQSLQNIMSSCSLSQEAKMAAPGMWPAGASAAPPTCRPPPPPPGADPAQAALILLLAVKVTSRASSPSQTAALLQDVVKQLESGVGAAEILKRLAALKEDSATAAATGQERAHLLKAPVNGDEKAVQQGIGGGGDLASASGANGKSKDLSSIISSLVSSAQNMLTAVQQQQAPPPQQASADPSPSAAGANKNKRDPQLMEMLYKSFQARMKNGVYSPDSGRSGRRQFHQLRSSPPKSSAPTPAAQVTSQQHRPFCPKPIQGAKPTAAMLSTPPPPPPPPAAVSSAIPASSPNSSSPSYPAQMTPQAPLMVPPQPPAMNPAAAANVQTNAVLAQLQQQFAAVAAAAASNPYVFHQQATAAAAAASPTAYLTTNGLYPSAAMASNTFLSQQNAAAAAAQQQLMWQQSAAAAAASQWQQHSLETQSQVHPAAPPPPPPAQPEYHHQQEAISAAAQSNGYYGSAAYLLAGSKRKFELEHPRDPSHEEAVKKLKLVHQPSTVHPAGAMAAGTIADLAASAAMYATSYT